jgi:hypothetical protein
MRSNFTHAQSQRMTTIEVVILLTLSFGCWFTDHRAVAAAAMALAVLSLHLHFRRAYKP